MAQIAKAGAGKASDNVNEAAGNVAELAERTAGQANEVARAVDWDRVFRIQAEYLRASLERTAQLTRRYLEVSQAMTNSAVSAAQRQAKKAA